jgi:adenine/guanine phosphoribosyltransferase-like PRPP-binding protein
MTEPAVRPWKGLDTASMPAFIGYEQAERMIAALLEPAMRWRPEAVAGIIRGGLVPATMAACTLALPLAMLAADRSSEEVTWLGPPPSCRRILLIDDCCATGLTMRTARAALHRQGWDVLTLTVVHDPETTTYVPDLSHPMRELFRFPWERGEATPAARALRATGARADRTTEAPFVGLDLDGLLLTSTPIPLPPFAPNRAVLITTRPASERARIAAGVAGRMADPLPLEFPPAALPPDPRVLARYKAEAATRWGCTMYIETDPEQAIRIAALAPHLLVSWWSREGRAWPIGAAAPMRGFPTGGLSARPASPVGPEPAKE